MEHLLYYMRKGNIDDNLIYKKEAIDQMIFVRDRICYYLCKTPPFVISTHRSKSIDLPVYAFTLKNGIKIICRNNFYDWKVSVILPKPFEYKNDIISDIISNSENIPSCYCEGFDESWVFETYNPDDKSQTKFTVEVSDKYNFFLLIYTLTKQFSNIEFNSENKMSIDEIGSKLNNIFIINGVYSYDSKGEQYMKGYDLFIRTDYLIDNKKTYETDENGYVHASLDYSFDDSSNIEKFAEYILKFNDAYEEFLFESMCYDNFSQLENN